MFSNELVCNIIEYLNDNINKEITINELSLLFYFDKTYIMKRFKRELGISIHEYINTIRIYNSCFLLSIPSALFSYLHIFSTRFLSKIPMYFLLYN